jgi:DeoR/GlpR family transcriptional regulator of sugar metabolism
MIDGLFDGRKSAGTHRRERICELLLQEGYLDVSELSRQLAVNTVTIRRDLDRLEAAGLLRRAHGRAYASQHSVGVEMSFSVRMNYRAEAKASIAKRAAELIQEGDTVYIDAGTSALMVAHLLAKRRSLAVVTHSLDVAEILKQIPGISLFVIGGQYFPHTHCMVGPQAEEAVRGYRYRKLILGTAGIDFRGQGLTMSSLEEVPIKRAAIAQSERVILVADQSKYDKVSLISMIPLAGVHTLVSDAPPSPDEMSVLDHLKIEFQQA